MKGRAAPGRAAPLAGRGSAPLPSPRPRQGDLACWLFFLFLGVDLLPGVLYSHACSTTR